jgi:predicted Zn finger-like uncharacterized protein
MLIVCPSCATSYDVDAASLRPNGRQVRCVRCRSVWHAELTQAEKLIAAAEALAPVRRAVEAMAEVVAEDWPPAEEQPVTAETEAADEPEPSSGAVEEEPPAPPENVEAPSQPSELEVESPPIAPEDLDTGDPAAQAEVAEAEPPALPEDVESVAAPRYPSKSRRDKLSWPLSRLQSAILALVIIDAFIVGWRADFVSALPQTASFYAVIGVPVNLRGLKFDDLATTSEQHEGVPILVVEGNVINGAGKIVDVPRLRFAVRNAAREEIYSWTAAPPRALLSPNEAVGFRTRLASPPPDAHDVLVRFVNRIDLLAGAR